MPRIRWVKGSSSPDVEKSMKGFEKMKIVTPKIAPITVFEILKVKMSNAITETVIDKIILV